MTANSSSRLLPTTLQEKQNKIKQKSTFLMELLLGPVRHTLGHQNTKIFPPWSAALAAQSTISFLFFFFLNNTNKVKQDWERKEQWRHSTKNGPITTSSYLTQGLKVNTS